MSGPTRRALVTGGSGAIGGAISASLASAGVHVIVHANVSTEAAEETVRSIVTDGGTASTVAFDICNAPLVSETIRRLVADDPIQILVHCAGIHDDAPLAGMNERQWSRVVDVSLNGFFNVAQPLLLPMIRSRWGRVIAISSVTALLGNRGQANYAAAKAGLHGAVRTLALEYASRGVTGNVVAPGVIATPDSAEAFPEERIAAVVPMQRAGTPDDVAALVRFLASDDAGYVTGQVISVGGGLG